MNTWLALFKREWLEHRGGFGWAPVVVLGVLVVIVTLAPIVRDFTAPLGDTSFGDTAAGWLTEGTGSDAILEQSLADLRLKVAAPFIITYLLVAFFVLLGALFDDRRDRTVLFWKSVPVTDTQTVLSKLITTVWLAPILTIAAILVAQLFVLVVLSIVISGSDLVSVTALWYNSGLFAGLVQLVVAFIIQGFWSLPVWSWLLLVSSAVPRLPVLWAIFTPIAVAIFEWGVFDTSHFYDSVTNHTDLRALPALAEEVTVAGQTLAVQPAVGLPEMFRLWATFDMWFGIAVGVLFLAGAIHLRHRNNEI